MTNAAQTAPIEPVTTDHPLRPSRLLVSMTLLGGMLVAAPLFAIGKITPGFSLLALLLFLPYLVVCWRLLRTPGTKEGPGLAFGIGLTFTLLGLLVCAVNVEQRDYLRLAYFCGLVASHVLIAALGITRFRQATSSKPGWRVLVRSIVDPVAYYSIVLFLALGAHVH
jgi:hypothetical protein